MASNYQAISLPPRERTPAGLVIEWVPSQPWTTPGVWNQTMADETTGPDGQSALDSAAPALEDLVLSLVILESDAVSDAQTGTVGANPVLNTEFRVDLQSLVANRLRNSGLSRDVGDLLDEALQLWAHRP